MEPVSVSVCINFQSPIDFISSLEIEIEAFLLFLFFCLLWLYWCKKLKLETVFRCWHWLRIRGWMGFWRFASFIFQLFLVLKYLRFLNFVFCLRFASNFLFFCNNKIRKKTFFTYYSSLEQGNMYWLYIRNSDYLYYCYSLGILVLSLL